jgi:hypothetical protein
VFIAYIVVAVVLALGITGSATAKLRHDERVTTGLTGVGVPESWFVPLALLTLAGAIGLLAGIAWRPLGIAAAIGLVLYFLGALVFHVRAKDAKGMPMPTALLVVSAVALALGIASA